ncbi:MAG: hypothetical protein ABEI78_00890, partial [Candidatus Nanohaloarchaea archaeon]
TITKCSGCREEIKLQKAFNKPENYAQHFTKFTVTKKQSKPDTIKLENLNKKLFCSKICKVIEKL